MSFNEELAILEARLAALERAGGFGAGSIKKNASGSVTSATGSADYIAWFTGASSLAKQSSGSLSIRQDASGNLGFYNGATETAYSDNNGNLVFLGAGGGLTTQYGLESDVTNFIGLNVPSGGSSFRFNSANSTVLRISNGGIINLYNSIATVGRGIPPIYAAGAQTLNTNAAPTTLSYAPPTIAGVYRLSAVLNILTGGTLTFKIKLTYKDPGGNAVTDIPVFTQQNSATLLAGSPGANVTGRFYIASETFAIDNSGTAITVADNAGTYTAGTYYWVPVLEQLV